MSLSLVPQQIPPLPPPAPPTPQADQQSDAEVLAALIAQGAPAREARRRARALLDSFGGLRGLAGATAGRLAEAGLTEESTRLVQAAVEFGLRAAVAEPPRAPMDADTVAAMFRPLLARLAHEELHVVLLDARTRFMGRQRLASGGVASVSVFVRDVLRPVIEARASALCLVHNHPSGDCTPSSEDVALSVRVDAAADVLGLRLVDHLVVAEDGFSSAMPGAARWRRGSRAGSS